MFFDRNRIRRISRSAICRAALSAATVASLLSAQAAYAAPPTGCDIDTFFTAGFNTSAASGNAAGTSLASAEASTAQVMELVAQRRAQEAAVCPAGFVREGGICQPVRVTSAGRTQTARITSSTRKSVRRLPAETSDPFKQNEPDAVTSNGVWSQAFTDYERRTGLGDSTSSASRSQSTSGFLVGADHTVQVAALGVVVGVFGGASQTRQDFSSSVVSQLATQYHVDLHAQDPLHFPDPASVYDYTLPTDHTIGSLEKQTLKGPSLGASLSVFKGGFFSDGIVKADFQDLNRQGILSDTFARTLNANFEFPGNPPFAPGCISTNVNAGIPRKPVYTLTGLQTSASNITGQTTATNLILAENFGYHFDLANGYWVEPLVGARYTFATYGSGAQSLGLEDGHAVRVQGGARFGLTTLPSPQKVIWTTSFTGLLYSDVLIRGFVTNADGFSAGFLAADQGKLRVQGIWTARVDLLNGFSAFLECQARGGQDYYGYGGRIGGRYQW